MRLILAVAFLLGCVAAGFSHDHWISAERLTDPVTGQWCCDIRDCQEEPDNIEVVPGGVHVKSTHEFIPAQRIIWRSPGGWWRCRNLGGTEAGKTRCIIGPPQGS